MVKTLFSVQRLYQLGFVMLIIFAYWQATTPKPIEYGVEVNDKVLHILAFFAFGAWGAVVWFRRSALITLFIFLIGYGAFIEISQYFVPGRQASWLDWFGDIFGAALGMAFSVIVLPWLGNLIAPKLYACVIGAIRND